MNTTQKITKSKKFENVELNDIVSYEENGMINTGVVDMVNDKIFTLRVVSSWDNNGTIMIYERYLHFFKSGKKTNRFYTFGSAIEITGKIF
jgi:hypothetical protein